MHGETSIAGGLLLGFVQGVTEFLPISSDGHLAIVEYFLRDGGGELAEIVLLHVGTLLATCVVLRAEIRTLLSALFAGRTDPRAFLRTPEGREIVTVIAATIPTGIVGLLLRDAVEPLAADLRIVGGFLLVTAAIVGSTWWTREGEKEHLSVPQALLLGVVQGLAVLPGVSRSGSTIALAMAMGLKPQVAFRLSFLLSLPAVLGASILELSHPGVLGSFDVGAYVGTFVAFLVGCVALRFLRGVVSEGRFALFAVYLVPLGVLLLVFGRGFGGQ